MCAKNSFAIMANDRLRIASRIGSLLLVLTLMHQVVAFNLDTVNYINFDGNNHSMFGFSLALHQESKISYVIIGAPAEDTSKYQRDVQRGGAVFKCDIRENNQCIMIPFDRNGNYFNDKGEQVDTKSNQWFGATVASGGIDGPVVACAPRYVYHTLTPKKVERVDPVGTCYVAKNNFREFTEYSPCRTMYWGYHRQGSCQAGFSAAISKDGERMLIGAPGSWYWQGQAYSINTASHFPFKPPRYGQFGEGGQLYSSLLTRPEGKVYQTSEGKAAEDDSYLGYSSATGDVAWGQPGVAVGMPRGGNLLGKVLVYTWNLTNIQNITGEQIGAYFGYSLCVVDVDGDGRQDIIIGAPMYTEPNNEGKYEVGRVYIMYQGANGFDEADTRDGFSSRGRFGLALTSLGDINLDGFGDFAVGAPYDGPKGRGAVYIFHGSKNGLLAKPSQTIFAEDVSRYNPVSTFGFSLSGGIDLDGNLYPDLAIGAYESNAAFVLKSRPVAVVEASTVFESENKLISLDNLGCTLPSTGKKVACTMVTSCLKYHGKNLPQTIDLEISWVLDSKKTRQPRMFFVREDTRNVRNQTIRLTRGKSECLREQVYIAESIRDKLTPLEVEMKYDMRQQLPSIPHIRRPRSILEPVLDHNVGLVQRDSINIQKNCGPDNECIPDLRLDVKAVDKYLLGSKDLLVVEVIVMNHGEDAFESNFFMTIPPGLNYKRVDKKGDVRDIAMTCTAPHRDNNNVLKCELGNPFPGGKVAKFNVILNPAQKAGMAPSYDFYMEANSTNSEREGSGLDNVYKKTIGIWLETDLVIKGNSYPQEFHYNLTQYTAIENSTKEEEIGPQVVHIYDISNIGPSTIEEAEIYVIWPYETQEGDELMYLLSRPETSGNIRCEDSPMINPNRLQINSALQAKGVLEEFTGVVSKSEQGFAKKQEGGEVSKVAIEKTSSSSGGSFSSSSSSGGSRVHNEKRLTDEEKRRLDAEENLESTGDASLVHRSRQQGQHGGASGNYQQSSSYSSQSGGNGGSPVTYTRSQNRSSFTGADGKTRTVETSTEYANVQRSSFGGAGASSGSSSSSSSYRQQGSTSGNHQGMYKIPDIQTEEVINHELSNSANSRSASSSGGGRISNVNTIETTPKPSGRRRLISQQDGDPIGTGYSGGATTQMEKMAQGGHGFQASTMDLGVMGGRANVDDDLHRHGGSATTVTGGSSSSSSTYGGGSAGGQRSSFQTSQSSGGASYGGTASGGKFQYGSNPSRHYASNSHSTHGTGATGDHHLSASNYNDEEGDNDYSVDDYDYDTADQTGHHQTAPSSSSFVQHGGSHGHHQQQQFNSNNNQNDKIQHYRRFQRDVASDDDHELEKELSACNATKCAVLKCYAGPLVHDDRAFIGLRTRLVAYTLDKNTLSVPLNISSKLVARIVKLPYIGEPQEKPLKTFEVPVKAIPEPIVTPDVVPLWVVILSAVAGILILLLLIYLLYKCGFFKRNRPTDHSQERQPLNRNGNYHGDEHL